VKSLPADKAEVNARDKDGWTPLYEAAQNGHKDIAELLRKHGGHE
jgi:ankyrin repeat protein